ncbi:hypothetical protein P152DRAFT_440977 [Eremomyces bilateralis CBS 781.70]|uniref:Pre-rRNA processing protein n=1 Tax=Eremomyces bilateralis CBS 781.70 TaxID=1392243 RepID=A0A6G1FVK8_9PEZI|nr:uncharacterized protein P152DRAFT_440977 [Eremomyces bilateralis CBS 781.70]KAF1809935.1 hypothetical protein P152DRAFT_440977 [Eremomyces bilateralis CBS 781.70]
MADPAPDTTGASTSRSPSSRSLRSRDSQGDKNATERTPLLSRNEDVQVGNHEDDEDGEVAASGLAETHSLLSSSTRDETTHPGKRWPSAVALLLLCLVAAAILVFRFVVPVIIEEYASQAVVFEPTTLTFDSVTPDGVHANVEFMVQFDSSRVERFAIRNLGRIGTWIAREIQSGESRVNVFLPDFGDAVVGIAVLPPVKADVRDKRVNKIKEVANLIPAAVEPIRSAAGAYFRGQLTTVNIRGIAHIPVRSGIIDLGNRTIIYSRTVSATDIPAIPKYNITHLVVHDADLPDGNQGLQADVSMKVPNPYPLDLTIPPLGFGILVDGCSPNDPQIMVADAFCEPLHISPNADIVANGTGFVRRIPESLMDVCPGSQKSPLDMIVKDYIHGAETTVYIRGSDSPDVETPKWITNLLSSITIPVPFKGPAIDHLIRNFSLTDVHFKLPDPESETDNDPEISADIEAIVNLPDQLDFTVNVSHVRALADVHWKEKKLGELNLQKWQEASSRRLTDPDELGGLLVQAHVDGAPLKITDQDLFTQLVATLLFKKQTAFLTIEATVDVKMATTLTALTLRDLPASGVFPIKPIGLGSGWGSLAPQVGNVTIVETTPDSIQFLALANFTNPTNYSATVPYFDIKVVVNGTVLGHATTESIEINPGNNTNIVVRATYDPITESGNTGAAIGRELISQYLSGYNTTITLRTHRNSIPSHPEIGEALSSLEIEFPTPSFGSAPGAGNGDGSDGKPHFIQGATMHLWSSTATFLLVSPLTSTTLFITKINATAFYKHDPVGHLQYEFPFAVPPGISETPRLPVDWDAGSVGYDAVRKALGGSLKLHAEAEVGVRVGRWEEWIWYKGKGIGAKVRL